ncbi:hypothetical protein E8E13_010386 [Curvularia kusanoi]|uniref:Uncharacterized protein n=1 Tax=Curvularia kusanoi TaxID=90978 RepID=A0A9P4TK89_CURKU|nr:hypothetical protein E8E13_010386 [Curvularia kusanoi]
MNQPQEKGENYPDTLHKLRTAKYYAFDLDDTLHNFRSASSTASKSIFSALQPLSTSPIHELESSYQKILSQGTSSAFVDGKTSHQYRSDRFQKLVDAHGIQLQSGEMQKLVELYERVLMETLERKEGVLELFQTLKSRGHSIAVVTEGPQDAQERTVEALGITPYIDYLATTNKLGVAKVDGLFVKVLEHLDLKPADMVVIGDSWERDVVPASQAGLYCVHYSEKDGSGAIAQGWRVSGLEQLRLLVEAAHDEPVNLGQNSD